jgi:lipoprotein-anchoring transpeptidase ErfK/SrfK
MDIAYDTAQTSTKVQILTAEEALAAYDTAQNAYVLDVNTGPAPTGTHYASWSLFL